LVIEATSALASMINNDGIAAQITYLEGWHGDEELLRRVRGEAEDAEARVTPGVTVTETDLSVRRVSSMEETVALFGRPCDPLTGDSAMSSLHEVALAYKVTPQMIADQMVAAIEGGINYWCARVRPCSPSKGEVRAQVEAEGREFVNWYQEPWYYDRPFRIEVLEEDEATAVILTQEAVAAGLKLLAERYPDRLREIVEETGDAETADVFLQCCLFGEIRYG